MDVAEFKPDYPDAGPLRIAWQDGRIRLVAQEDDLSAGPSLGCPVSAEVPAAAATGSTVVESSAA